MFMRCIDYYSAYIIFVNSKENVLIMPHKLCHIFTLGYGITSIDRLYKKFDDNSNVLLPTNYNPIILLLDCENYFMHKNVKSSSPDTL